MHGAPSTTPDDLTAYLRQARRLRARLAKRPLERTRKLQQLAASRDRLLASNAQQAPPPSTSRPAASLPLQPVPRPMPVVASNAPLLQIPPSTAAEFAAEVEAVLAADHGLLRYSQRCRLLLTARRLRIRPFEANLLIASVLHHHREHSVKAQLPPEHSPIDDTPAAVLAGLATLALLAVLIGLLLA